MTYLTLLFYGLCCFVSVFGLFYKIIFEINENNQRSTKSIATIKFINMGFLLIAVICMFVLFIGRIYFTFRGTAYAYSKSIIYQLLIYCMIESIIFIIIVVLWSLNKSFFVLTFWIGLLLMHTLFSTLVLYLFIKKLIDLISKHNSIHRQNNRNRNRNRTRSNSNSKSKSKNTRNNNSNNTNNNNKNQNTNKNKNKNESKLFQSVARSTMLTSIAIIVTFFAMVIQSLFFAYGVPDEWINENSAMFFLISMDNGINVLTIYLNSKFANKWYDLLCSCCLRTCCETWLAGRTDKINGDERNLTAVIEE